MARRPTQHRRHGVAEDSDPRDGRLEILIAVALGVAAIVTAGAVYLNEHQEHKATLDFHEATHRLLDASSAGLRTPRGHALEASSEDEIQAAEDHQDKAARYTLAEVILATSLFLLGVAGISTRRPIKVGALSAGGLVFLSALLILATA